MASQAAGDRDVTRLLSQGPLSAAQLSSALGVSQPTLSRTIRALANQVTLFRVKGQRTPLYGLLRHLPLGLNPRQRIYRHLGSGTVAPFADVEFLAGGATVERMGSQTTLYVGLPPYMSFAALSGFLGRQTALEVSASQPFPSSLRDWRDEHHIAYLFTRGLNLPGNLIFGDTSLQLEMNLREQPPTPVGDRLDHYVAMASALKGASMGSSAGGEQPKFLAYVEDCGHVIVKFARRGSRMSELLPLEHLALRALGASGIPASSTQVLASDEYVFLEVVRFDRAGASGRIGTLSAGAVDDEYFGLRDTWSEFAARCIQRKYLPAKDGVFIDTMAAFSELIGNNDRHFENISVLIGEDGEYSGVAPAYDILPMRYASIGGGIDPELTPINPKPGTIGVSPEVWSVAVSAAEMFWLAVQGGQTKQIAELIPKALRTLAGRNLEVVREFAGRLGIPTA